MVKWEVTVEAVGIRVKSLQAFLITIDSADCEVTLSRTKEFSVKLGLVKT